MQSIAFDGHDYAGKSIIVREIQTLCPHFTIIRPFSSLVGELFWWLYINNKDELAYRLAVYSVRKSTEEHTDESLLFLRHWMTVHSVMPALSLNIWEPKPTTFLVWADAATTNIRMADVNDKEICDGYNAHYCNVYREIAHLYDVPTINTTGMSENEMKVLAAEIVNNNPHLFSPQ